MKFPSTVYKCIIIDTPSPPHNRALSQNKPRPLPLRQCCIIEATSGYVITPHPAPLDRVPNKSPTLKKFFSELSLGLLWPRSLS